jgi:hypothetical protein
VEHVRLERREAKSLSAINLLLGMWLIISPFMIANTSATLRYNQVIIGVIVIIMSAIRFLAPAFQLASWANGLSGVWMIISPFLLYYRTTFTYWNAIATGVLIAVLAFWNTSLYTEHYHHRHPVV